MRAILFSSALSTLLLAGCAHHPPTNSGTPTTPLLFPAASGGHQARRDIAAGRLQLMAAGTRAVDTPNVPIDDPRFARLPIHRLPSGCTHPNATAWIRYAEAYNSAVVEHVRRQPTQ